MTSTTTKRAALYLRVSTGEQSTEMRRTELAAIAARAGWQIVEVYEDAGVSGAKGRDQRPQFDRMLKDATRRKFDVLAVWATDRLGRSLQDLVATLSELRNGAQRDACEGTPKGSRYLTNSLSYSSSTGVFFVMMPFAK